MKKQPLRMPSIIDLATSALSASSVSNKKPLGMTLIELLVVIVILTTLVATIVPVLSPNNDTRKIREATRGLHSYITLAQAKAARSGRPAGVFFKKLSLDTRNSLDRGVCVEVFQLAEPAPFAGFAENSTLKVNDLGGSRVTLQFGSGLGISFNSSPADALPPRMFKLGDIFEVAGYLFRIDDPDPFQLPTDLITDVENGTDQTNDNTKISRYNGTVYIDPTQSPIVDAQWLNWNPDMIAPPEARPYSGRRLPLISSQSPYQLPRGICIDLQASGMPTTVSLTSSSCQSPFNSIPSLLTTDPNMVNNDDGIAVMFGPNGGIHQYLWNAGNIDHPASTSAIGNTQISSQVFFLVGRRENIPTPITTIADWDLASLTPEYREELREKINWLNSDSRWVAIGARTGRVITAENNFLDLSLPGYSPPTADLVGLEGLKLSVSAQITAARQFASEMKREGGK